MQEQNRKPGNRKGKVQMVHHQVRKRWARQSLPVVLLAARDLEAGAAAAGCGEKVIYFFPGHVLTAHLGVTLD